jgi:hypothetical protein
MRNEKTGVWSQKSEEKIFLLNLNSCILDSRLSMAHCGLKGFQGNEGHWRLRIPGFGLWIERNARGKGPRRLAQGEGNRKNRNAES